MKKFKLNSPYKPLGDQPKAINSLVDGINKGEKEQTLLGVTGSGKTFTMANVIEKVQKPTLVISHNKTLAAQLYEEFKEFFPDNAVEYFVSYYDYYQPEAYVPRTDTFIDKESSVYEEIDIMRHSATQSLLSRDDVIVVSSVSCIYGIGSPEDYGEFAFGIAVGDNYDRSDIIRKLVFMQYERNDNEFARGHFRVRGDVIEINPVHGTPPVRVELFGDEIDAISLIDKVTGKKTESLKRYMIFPAKHFVVGQDKMDTAIRNISDELDERLNEFNLSNKLLEAQRLEQRTRFDIEMLQEMGIHDAFSGEADFSGLSPDPLYFNVFKQQSVLRVDERGTEAASVTWAGLDTSLPEGGEEPVAAVTFDRPFYFFIQEKSTGLMLFMGKVEELNPE